MVLVKSDDPGWIELDPEVYDRLQETIGSFLMTLSGIMPCPRKIITNATGQQVGTINTIHTTDCKELHLKSREITRMIESIAPIDHDGNILIPESQENQNPPSSEDWDDRE